MRWHDLWFRVVTADDKKVILQYVISWEHETWEMMHDAEWTKTKTRSYCTVYCVASGVGESELEHEKSSFEYNKKVVKMSG